VNPPPLSLVAPVNSGFTQKFDYGKYGGAIRIHSLP